ncbi:MAG TPA: hypothetical protein VF610_11175 [Segetibacter sp.]
MSLTDGSFFTTNSKVKVFITSMIFSFVRRKPTTTAFSLYLAAGIISTYLQHAQ